jgi:hypothetical protein
MVNRYLRTVNSAFAQLAAKDGRVASIEVEHKGTKIGIMVVPKPSGDQLVLVAPLFRLPEENASRVFIKLLSINNGHTDVSRLSIDKETHMLNLVCIRNCASLDTLQFRHTLDTISAQFQRLKSSLMTEFGVKE